MEEIAALQTLSQSRPALSAGGEKTAALSSDFETFIRMLTAQMQNQDPLNPIESADFATQLATFSSVEQQVLTNDLLASLGAQMGAFNLSQMSGWVGMEARAVMPVHFDGTPVSIRTEGAPTAQSHQLVVRDTNGNVVAREDTPGTSRDVDWQGTDAFGAPLPRGVYDITVESFSQGERVASEAVEVKGKIAEARPDNGQVALVFEAGQEVRSEAILSLGRPGVS